MHVSEPGNCSTKKLNAPGCSRVCRRQPKVKRLSCGDCDGFRRLARQGVALLPRLFPTGLGVGKYEDAARGCLRRGLSRSGRQLGGEARGLHRAPAGCAEAMAEGERRHEHAVLSWSGAQTNAEKR